MKHKGKFIAFEGIDGSGKSTQVKRLVQRLKAEGYKVYETFEPTDSPIGSLIRNIMKGRLQATDETIAGLFVADRLDHIQNEVNGLRKKIAEGYIVICDRYCFSSYAYQGIHVPLDWVIQANSLATTMLRPDVHVFLDVTPEVSLDRIRAGRSHVELYETSDILIKVRNKYLEAFELLGDKENIAILDGTKELEVVSEDIWDLVLGVIESE